MGLASQIMTASDSTGVAPSGENCDRYTHVRAVPTPDSLLTAEHLANIEELLGRPFAEPSDGVFAHGANERFTIRALRVSGDFRKHEWEDEQEFDGYCDHEIGVIEADYNALVAALTRQWGPPITVDMAVFVPVLSVGGPLPTVVDALVDAGFFGSFPAWNRGGKWLGIARSQVDEESPHRLIAILTDGRIDEEHEPG
ncbi:hypothetical protein [Nocardia sp. NPDC057668]|uniref:hypothetical protein n=1 Tax=Nocardia sp. NPDC057668 TaxID=3346202 RepID=UPI0036701869